MTEIEIAAILFHKALLFAMKENEQNGVYLDLREKPLKLTATIKFSLREIFEMSCNFQKELLRSGMVARVIKYYWRRRICYEIRYRRNGYNISVFHSDLGTAKQLFIEETYKYYKIAA